MFDDGIFGGLFDLDGDGKLDFFEQGLEFMAILRNNLKSLIFQWVYAIIYLLIRNSSPGNWSPTGRTNRQFIIMLLEF